MAYVRPFAKKPKGLPAGTPGGIVTVVACRSLVAIGSGSFSELLRIKFTDTLPAPFLRGDADTSGEVNLTDAIYLLGYLFQGVEAPACLDSGDFDDDGRITLTDAILTLNYLFRGGIPPAAPFPGTGQDPTADGLQCR